MVTLISQAGQNNTPASEYKRSALPVLQEPTHPLDVQFGSNASHGRRSRIGAAIAALTIGLGSIGALSACSSSPDISNAVSGVSIQIDHKVNNVTPEIYSDGIIVNTTNNDVIGHFNENGDAFVGKTQVAMTSSEGKIYGLFKDDKNETRAIQIGSIDDNGAVTDKDGKSLGMVQGDASIINKQQKGAIAALTMYGNQGDSDPNLASHGHYVPPVNGSGGGYVPDNDSGFSNPGGNFWFWMWMMNSTRSPVIVERNVYHSYGAYRTQYNGSLDSNWRNAPPGSKIGAYGKSGKISSGGFGDSSTAKASGGFSSGGKAGGSVSGGG